MKSSRTNKRSDAMPDKIPNELGYHMPAEWEPHDAIWLSWPHDPLTFNQMDKVEKVFINIIDAIHKSERVNLLVKDKEMMDRIELLLKNKKIDIRQVNLIVHDYADVWFRDYGPIFIVKQSDGKKNIAMVHWIFNAWGRKYHALMKDTIIPEIINRRMKLLCFRPGIVMEGGSVDVNGKGTLITTEQCLLNKNRNPNLTKKQIEEYLKNYLSVRNIIWLKNGIAGDDTDGHVDDIARFVNPTTIVCVFEEDKNDENYLPLKENLEILKKARDQDGNPLKIIKLPMPGFVGDGDGRLPASYANFYIGNKIVLVPVFGHKNDRKAMNILKSVFPNREVIGINCTEMVYGLGTIHCASQQQPSI